jgi:excisionase family DNA binding protein
MATNDLKVSEAAGKLRVHPETIRVWLREGRFLHAYQLGRRGGWRIPSDDLTAMKEPAASTSRSDQEGNKMIGGGEATRRLPRTLGMVADESFQASESEAYMHEHRDREHVNVG